MKKLLLIGVALIAFASVFFLQCEKSESLGTLSDISFKSLSSKVWYLEKMKIDGEEIIFDEPVSVEFGKDIITIKPNKPIICNAMIFYAETQFIMESRFDCLQQLTDMNQDVKRLLDKMKGTFTYKISETKMLFTNNEITVQLVEKFTAVAAPLKLEGTLWEVKKLFTAPKDIMIEWTDDAPKLTFRAADVILDFRKNLCVKAISYPTELSVSFNGNFNCRINPCCSNDKNTKLSEQLAGEMTWEQPAKGILILKTQQGTQIYLNQLPAPGTPNTVPDPNE